VLQLFLSSPKPTMRFAAIRTLNKAAMTHAFAVASCNLDMENLITDQNRSISTLAITTLLKVRTGSFFCTCRIGGSDVVVMVGGRCLLTVAVFFGWCVRRLYGARRGTKGRWTG
jgi:hypothetical protein